MKFETYPFEKLTDLLNGIMPSSDHTPLTLTIGEPQFETPMFIQEALKESTSLLQKYPKTGGEKYLREAMLSFIQKRFSINLSDAQIIPTFGTREVLFNFPQFYLFDKQNPTLAYTNPFYQIYEGAAIASRAKTIYLNLTVENEFKPVINEEELAQCDLVIINFPNNPTSSSLTLNELKKWVELALKYDFVLINDECYSELYTNTPPPSLLNASIAAGNSDFKNILVLNSISKRSSAPGLRSGFIAGDASLLKAYMRYRTYVGAASPLPLQKAAAIAWSDERHVAFHREIYAKNLQLAHEILGVEIPETTFYIWLDVGDELNFTKKLYEEYNVKVLPGSFLGRDGMGEGYVRIALVDNEKNTKEALERIATCLKSI